MCEWGGMTGDGLLVVVFGGVGGVIDEDLCRPLECLYT